MLHLGLRSAQHLRSPDVALSATPSVTKRNIGTVVVMLRYVAQGAWQMLRYVALCYTQCYAKRNIRQSACCVLLRYVAFCCAYGCVQRNIGKVVDMLLYLA